MSELAKLTDFITDFCKVHSLRIESSSDGNFKIQTDEASGIKLILNASSPADFSFYFVARTHDVVYNGDRSDAHVILSLMFASFLRVSGFATSCSLFDIAHPVVEDEIWGRYIMPEQSSLAWGLADWDKLTTAVNLVLSSLMIWRSSFWQIVGCPCEECREEHKMDDNYEEEAFPAELDHTLNTLLKPTPHLNTNVRNYPPWSYFYDMKHEITIIKSEPLSEFLEYIQILAKQKLETVKGIKGFFLLNGELKHYVADKHIKELKKLYASIKHKINPDDIYLYALENMLVSVSKPYIIALGRLCGIHTFRTEREIIRERHNRESELLFPVTSFEWDENISAEQFENLIKALLEREPNVVRVRKASPTNQGDGGRDLVIEWNVRNSNAVSEHHPPTTLINVVGQCKSSKNAIGKSSVLDIRDTLESHKSQGYFLAVSTQITAPLTKKLEELQEKGIWTEWWNRDDIELRLSRNQDLLPLFSTVIKAKH